jgi:hypothetical protein
MPVRYRTEYTELTRKTNDLGHRGHAFCERWPRPFAKESSDLVKESNDASADVSSESGGNGRSRQDGIYRFIKEIKLFGTPQTWVVERWPRPFADGYVDMSFRRDGMDSESGGHARWLGKVKTK